MSGGIRESWSDRFNRYDLPAMVLTMLAVCLVREPEDGVQVMQPNHVLILRGFGAFFLWMRLARILLVFSRVGPYAFVVFVMVDDVISYGAILAIYPIAFAALLSAINEPPSSRGPNNLDWLPVSEFEPFLGSPAECSGWFDSFPNAFIFLLERAMTGESFFECSHQSDNPVTLWLIAFAYTTITGLLLLNMLIAMMAKSFDVISEAKAMNYQFLKAQLVISMARNPPAPPPFYALTVPWEFVLEPLLYLVGYDCYKKKTYFHHTPSGKAFALEEAKEGVTNDEATVDKTAMEKELAYAQRITKFIDENEDDSAQQERWRAVVKRDTASALTEVKKMHKKVEEVHEKLDEMQPEQESGQESLAPKGHKGLNAQVKKFNKAEKKLDSKQLDKVGKQLERLPDVLIELKNIAKLLKSQTPVATPKFQTLEGTLQQTQLSSPLRAMTALGGGCSSARLPTTCTTTTAMAGGYSLTHSSARLPNTAMAGGYSRGYLNARLSTTMAAALPHEEELHGPPSPRLVFATTPLAANPALTGSSAVEADDAAVHGNHNVADSTRNLRI